MVSSRSEILAGVRAQLPILLGTFLFGVIYGALAIKAGLPPLLALAMSSIVFAGSSQLIGTALFAAQAPGVVIVLTTLIVNLRHLLYSASVAPFLQPLRPIWKWLLAYLLTDEAYAVAITHYNRADAPAGNKHWYFLSTGLTLWLSWQISTAVGIFVGGEIPNSWSFDFAVALTFIALLVPALKDRPSIAAAVVAGGVAVMAHGWQYRLGLTCGALAGIAVGLWLESRQAGALHLDESRGAEPTGEGS